MLPNLFDRTSLFIIFFKHDVYNSPEKFKSYIKEYEFSKINKNIIKKLLSRDKNNIDISKLRYIYTATSFLVHRFMWCGDDHG